ncbi:brain acid soluble protein 1-like [Manduca sexta]|uniref:brain acid soluble protein 1-like n=1 Tax=Manduca sexta TaxID=7130 RepID=UPI00188FD98D|nr:brain acid soluble protein 1-like [Manduca sexta]
MLAMVEARVQARLESALMGPAQRPTLAHERRTASGDTELPSKGKRKEKGTAQPAPAPAPLPAPVAGPSSAPPQPLAGPSTAPATTTAATAKTRTEGERRRNKSPKGQEERTASSPTCSRARVLPPAPANVDTPWVEVVRRKKKKPAAAPTNSTHRRNRRAGRPKLRPPRSAAVVISHTSSNCEGPNLQERLTDAQNKVDLTGLEISKMRPKFAATGAPMYEVPGANSEERADSLAARLRECFARVGRYQNLPAHEEWNCG